MTEPAHPASKEAIEQGCTCDPKQNNHGKGTLSEETKRYTYYPDPDCPMHNMETICGPDLENGGN